MTHPRRRKTVLAWLAACAPLVSCGQQGSKEIGIHFSKVQSGPHVEDVASSPSASWVDIDRDGDDDLYVLNGYGSLENDPVPQPDQFLLNDGNGAFELVPDHPLTRNVTFSGGATWGDYDNDGDLDVFVANQREAVNSLFRHDQDGSFARITDGHLGTDGGRSFIAVWVDIDNDGWLDLHVLNGRSGEGGQEDFVYRNLGDGRFERLDSLSFARMVLPSGGATWGDFDGDGDADLFLPVNSTSETNHVYRNDGGWTFTEVSDEVGLTDDPLPYSPRSSAAHWVDYDGDLDLDLYVGNALGEIDYLFRNDGHGRFERIIAGRIGLDITYVSDAVFADVDNDADLDLVIAVWGGASELFRNDGEGRFFPAPSGDLGAEIHFASSVSANDADNDGDLDLYLTQWPVNDEGGAPNLFYLNRGSPGNWIKIDLEGTDSNRSAIGARIILTATVHGRERKQLRYVSARTTWRSTSSLTQHFGLADADHADQIEVHWPSGNVTTYPGPVEANQRVRIAEGSPHL